MKLIATETIARKVHACSRCRRRIEIGEKYFSITIGGAGLSSIKFPDRACSSCVNEEEFSHIFRKGGEGK